MAQFHSFKGGLHYIYSNIVINVRISVNRCYKLNYAKYNNKKQQHRQTARLFESFTAMLIAARLKPRDKTKAISKPYKLLLLLLLN